MTRKLIAKGAKESNHKGHNEHKERVKAEKSCHVTICRIFVLIETLRFTPFAPLCDSILWGNPGIAAFITVRYSLIQQADSEPNG